MKRYFGLLNTIAQEYNIIKGILETETSWKARIIYSLLAQIGYSSLWDIPEDTQPISIVHFKERIEEALASLLSMYPEMRAIFSGEPNNLSTEIYNIMSSTGCIYHMPNRISASICTRATGGSCVFSRGQAISEKQWMSGIGCFLPVDNINNPKGDLLEMFQLHEDTVVSSWRQITSEVKWGKVSEDIKFQYLRNEQPFTYGYWTDSPDNSGEISIARTGFRGNRLYYLYKVRENNLMMSQLPNWMTSGYNYRNLSVACLADKGVLPSTIYHVDGEIVSIHIEYLYPPAELNLIKLYSWPTTYIDLPHDFYRIMSFPIFEDIKETLQSIGYHFKEE